MAERRHRRDVGPRSPSGIGQEVFFPFRAAPPADPVGTQLLVTGLDTGELDSSKVNKELLKRLGRTIQA